MITSVMYHYVRPIEDSALRYLSIEDFEKQLDWLKASVGDFMTEIDWEDAKQGGRCDGVLLTFDDGLKDHIRYVLPVLQKRGLFAIFFVNTAPLISKQMLAVHLTHRLLSVGKSHEMLEFFKQQLPISIWSKLNSGVAAKAYTKHSDLDVNISIKKIVNYLYKDFNLPEVLSVAAEKFLFNSLTEVSKSWYLSVQDINLIADAGMKIGSHTSTHRLLSQLSNDEIFNELSESKIVLESILDRKIDEFCYPYGGAHSYNRIVHEYLEKLGYSVAHDVAPRKISKKDIKNKYALPRFNCNELPFGIAHSLKN